MNKKFLILILAGAVIVLGGVAAFAPASPFKLNLNQFALRGSVKNPVSASSTSAVPLYKPVIDYEQAVINAVEKASPAVVSVIVSKDLPVIEDCPYNPFSDLPPNFQQFFDDRFQFSQPCQKGTKSQEVGGGSGFVIAKDGLIVTNKHVVADSGASYTVLANDGKKYDAKVLARHPFLDIAVLKIKPLVDDNLSVLILGDSDSIKLGQTAIAIGNALGEFRNTVSVGTISGLARTVTAQGEGMTETIEGVIQTDAAINQGNSGGPLLNLKGEVIGINTAMVTGAQNIGFALPINQVKKAIESVKNTGEIKVPYLGVRYLRITSDLAKKEKLPVENGALIRGSQDGPAITPDSPAKKAGLQAEDIIKELNGEKLDQDNSLAYLIQKYNVGDKVSLKILRNGQEIILEATLEEKPA
ncbi:MAG: trypsin-like peptidase domain-containing protein, partial [Patescibacteria group bacterium]